MKIQILKNYLGQVIKAQTLKTYEGKQQTKELEKYMFGQKKSDSTGNMITIISVVVIGLLVVYGFFELVRQLQGQGEYREFRIDPPEIVEGFYAHYGPIGNNRFIPVLNIRSKENLTVQVINSVHPIVKDFYIVKSSDPSLMKNIYEMTQYLGYNYRIISSRELESVPEGSFIIYADQILDENIYNFIKNSSKPVTIIFLSFELPVNYRPSGGIPQRHNLFNQFPVEFNIRTNHPILGPMRVEFHIPEANINNFTSYHYDRSRNKLYIFFPVGGTKNDRVNSTETLVRGLKYDLEMGTWANSIAKRYSEFDIQNIFEGARFIPITVENKYITDTVILYSIEKSNTFFVSSNMFPYKRGQVLSKDMFFLPRTEQSFNIKYEPYGIRNERRDVEIRLLNSTYDPLIKSIKIGVLDPMVTAEYKRVLDLREGLYLLELLSDGGSNILSRSIIVASDIYPYAEYRETMQGREIRLIFYSFDKSPIYVENIKYYLPWEDRTYEERFVSTNGIVIDLKQPLTSGNYSIRIQINNQTYYADFRVLPRTALDRLLFGNPISMVSILLSIVLVLGANYLRPKPPIIYSIDIPEAFPPVEVDQIVLDEEMVKRAFHSVENYYKWKHIPLTEEEISEGLRTIDVRFENAIIDSNTLSIALNTLTMRGVLKKYRDYYILSEWENESGYTIEQLVMYRTIRDSGLEMGIIFELDTNNRIKYTTEYGDGIIYLYNPNRASEIIKSILENLNQDLEIVVIAKDFFDLKDFQYRLYFLSGGMLVAEYIRNDRIQIYTLDDYLQRIKIIY
ncbi:MAG: hypothetical protein N3C61_01350 [Candidatus Micrarchaeota archaeon]|nr:hypothetical protein [Candidatus Micrarchaeota archaeon]